MESAALTRVPGSPPYLLALRADLLRFAARSRDPLGFGWLDDHGLVDPTRTVQLWITCRMTHVFSLAVLAAEPPAVGGPDAAELEDLAAHGVASLLTSFADAEHGGWFAEIAPEGPVVEEKSAYAHAFVVLAATSAAAAGIDGADRLLADALEVSGRRFWDDEHGMVVDSWNRDWTVLDPYRGINATMHTVEAYLAAADVTGDARVGRAGRPHGATAARRRRGARVADPRALRRGVDAAAVVQPRHAGRPVPAVRRDDRARARVGAAAGRDGGHRRGARTRRPGGRRRPDRCCRAARRSRDRRRVGGRRRRRLRLHHRLGGRSGRAQPHALGGGRGAEHRLGARPGAGRAAIRAPLEQWWAYADAHLVDGIDGSWHHELDTDNSPTAATWSGKPDAYHVYQAALVPTLPITPVLAVALRRAAG